MALRQGLLFPGIGPGVQAGDGRSAARLAAELSDFRCGERQTEASFCTASDGGSRVEILRNQFWSAVQRDANRLHEVSYRACFKPALPRFFIERLTVQGERVHDPFLGRGTTALEAALLGRVPSGCDINPLSAVLVAPRLAPPRQEDVRARLAELPLANDEALDDDLLAFFHPRTLRDLLGLRRHLLEREAEGSLDPIDRWIRMVAVNRLTGHSAGFLSVYTLPPNQAVSASAQRKINARRGQSPPSRDLRAILLKKSASLLAEVDDDLRSALARVAVDAQLLCADSASTPQLASGSVALIVTSPPFLDVVQYRADNWLRCWFCGIDAAAVPVTESRRLEDWEHHMTSVLAEQRRVLRPGGHIAFEVGEVRGGKVRLEEHVLACASRAGLESCFVVVQDHAFTKTANCWGIANNRKGTNTNRVVILRRPEHENDLARRAPRSTGPRRGGDLADAPI